MQDFEDILEMFEDYKRDPRPMDQEPRNMAQGGRIGYADENAGTLVKKLIPLDKTKLDAANLKRVQDSVNELYEKHTKEYVDNAAKEWAKKSNLEKNRTRKIENTDLPLDQMKHEDDRRNFRKKFKEDII